MSSVIAMQKQLQQAPNYVVLPRVELRNFADTCDVSRWLELRARALPHTVRGRPWSKYDFAREFQQRDWWCNARMWFAQDKNRQTLGTVTLGERGVPGRSEPSIHWLLVDPDHRRQGIGRVLVAAVEEACWQTGRTKTTLETLSSWTDAVAFYETLGYAAI